ncbi:MAG: M20/M25/M40 family metallo-hydrolase, partial [Acidobacteriota bacterium]
GRADLWARLPHTGSEAQRPIILLNHMDVVTSDASHWKAPPFGADIVNGSIYGRGAQDMKNEGLAQLVVMVMLKREKVPLNRDVIFLAVSDEEAGGTGTDWMIANKRDLLENAEFLINEGGENLLEDGKVRYIGVDVGEKTTFWLHVVAHGRPGHGSRPIPDSAPNRLVRALDRILAYRTPLKVLPIMDEFLHVMAPFEPPARAKQFLNMKEVIQEKKFQDEIERDESLNFLLRDTISLTMLGGSGQTNVIPPDAWANLDVRLLPGGDPQAFLQSIRRVVDDPDVTVQPLNAEFRVANSSPTNTKLFQAIRRVSNEYFPGTPVAPRITSGYTENQRYRPLGINSYGFSPYTATSAEGSTEHGNDERVRVEEVRRAPRILYDVVTAVAGK